MLDIKQCVRCQKQQEGQCRWKGGEVYLYTIHN